MTDSDSSALRLAPVPEEANTAMRPEKWKPVPGCSAYEASDYSVWQRGEDGKLTQVTGGIRSVDRVSGTRRLKGQPIRARILANSGGYAAVDLTDDTGTRRTMLVHRVILAAHDKPCPPGMETLHSERGPLWNRYPEDIRWGLPPDNEAERAAALAAKGRAANGRPMRGPKPPPAPCIRCGGPVATGGRRCHECVVAIGKEAADLMRAGTRLEDANEQLGYANAVYLHALAVKYGGWGCCPACSRTATKSRSVTMRERLGRVLGGRIGHGA